MNWGFFWFWHATGHHRADWTTDSWKRTANGVHQRILSPWGGRSCQRGILFLQNPGSEVRFVLELQCVLLISEVRYGPGFKVPFYLRIWGNRWDLPQNLSVLEWNLPYQNFGLEVIFIAVDTVVFQFCPCKIKPLLPQTHNLPSKIKRSLELVGV